MKTTRLLFFFLLVSVLILTSCGEDEDATCNDGIQNGTETGVDCGGTCPACVFACGSTITDIDGNVYNTVTIGTQCWMKENLKTSKYNDGTSITTGLSNDAWVNTSTGAYSIYDNNDANNTTYGKLYNWYTVNTGKLCPTGWHIPSNVEWTLLVDFLGGEAEAGGKMKSTIGWLAPNTGATNSSGFTGLSGSARNNGSGIYGGLSYYGYWWSNMVFNADVAFSMYLTHNKSEAELNPYDKGSGFSCRCIKD
jgi:uncharacterized protein (TIGR02145 family)